MSNQRRLGGWRSALTTRQRIIVCHVEPTDTIPLDRAVRQTRWSAKITILDRLRILLFGDVRIYLYGFRTQAEAKDYTEGRIHIPLLEP